MMIHKPQNNYDKQIQIKLCVIKILVSFFVAEFCEILWLKFEILWNNTRQILIKIILKHIIYNEMKREKKHENCKTTEKKFHEMISKEKINFGPKM